MDASALVMLGQSLQKGADGRVSPNLSPSQGSQAVNIGHQLAQVFRDHALRSGATAVAVGDQAVRDQLNSLDGPPAAFKTLQEAVSHVSEIPITGVPSLLVVVYGLHNVGDLTIAVQNLSIQGIDVHDHPATILMGCLDLQRTGITLRNLKLVADGNKPCVLAPQGVALEHCIFERKSSFNSTFVCGVITQELNVQRNVSRPGLRAALKAAAAGAVGGAALYWAILLPLLVAAGGPVSLGPGAMLLGPAALHWTASVGTAFYAGLGTGLGSVGSFSARGAWDTFWSYYYSQQERIRRVLSRGPRPRA